MSRTKAYRNALHEIDQMISVQITQVQKVSFIAECIIENKEIIKQPELLNERKTQREELMKEVETYIQENPKNLSTKTGRKKKQKAKGETYQITFAMIKEGLSPEEVAEKRGLVLGTIESHLAKGIQEGEVEIDSFMSAGELDSLAKAFGGNPNLNITGIFKDLDGKYSYGKLRMMQAHLRKETV